VSPARGPPTDWGELVQIHDDRDVFQASTDELTAIDIHSLYATPDARHRSPGNGNPGRCLRPREKTATAEGCGELAATVCGRPQHAILLLTCLLPAGRPLLKCH